MQKLLLKIAFGFLTVILASSEPIPDRTGLGFPVTWNGDKYKNWPCKMENIPNWIDGYFLSQLSASYGNQSNPDGQKLVHMFDGMGAIASFNLMKGDVQFSGAYYPWLGYKIWDLYGRDLTKSQVAWSGRSPFNATSANLWTPLANELGLFGINPNVDFWLVGTKLIGGTEVQSVGLSFDAVTLSDFSSNAFVEASAEFTSNQYAMINQPIHGQKDKDGNLWNTDTALSVTSFQQSQVLFTVTPNGTRIVQGLYDYAPFNSSLCSNGEYQGDKSTTFGGYMHSITSTDNFIVLPMSSSPFDTCGFLSYKDNITNGIAYPGGTPFDANVNLRFLLFNKNTKEFVMVPHNRPYFITHQFNAYENENGTIIADMLAYDSAAPYNELLMVNNLLNSVMNSTHVIRFTIDPKNKITGEIELMPGLQSIEFSQFNHRYTNQKYKYGYALQYPYALGSQIIKIDIDDHSGNSNKVFKPKEALAAVGEPVFIPSPGAKAEDDGVLLVRGLDPDKKLGLMYVVDAKTMAQIGEAWAPDLIPFGFHNQFFSRERLGLPPTPDKTDTTASSTTTTNTVTTTTNMNTTATTTSIASATAGMTSLLIIFVSFAVALACS